MRTFILLSLALIAFIHFATAQRPRVWEINEEKSAAAAAYIERLDSGESTLSGQALLVAAKAH